MNDHSGASDAADSGAVLIDRAASLIPALRQRAAQTERDRKLPLETVEDFRRLGLTRCLQPREFGGFSSDYRAFSRMLRQLARGCGSSAWVCAVHGEHNWVIAQYPEAVQRQVWGDNPNAVASASLPPTGAAEPVSGGHRLKGRWSFASGCDHAQWLLLNAMTDAGRKREERLFLVPKSEIEIVDDWHVMGLAGTGSKSLLFKGDFVPAQRSLAMRELRAGTTPGALLYPLYSLYRTPRNLLASFSLTSVNVGLAERAVEDFTAASRERRSRGIRVADLESTQIAVAEAEALVESAVLLTETTIERNIEAVERGEAITVEQVAWTRRNSAYATRLAYAAVKLVFEIAGGTALYEANPLQEIFRDATAGASHIALSWQRTAPLYGQIRLGLPLDFDAV